MFVCEKVARLTTEMLHTCIQYTARSRERSRGLLTYAINCPPAKCRLCLYAVSTMPGSRIKKPGLAGVKQPRDQVCICRLRDQWPLLKDKTNFAQTKGHFVNRGL